jgi:pimeloyl-ACP methyl ester carboxylesterase
MAEHDFIVVQYPLPGNEVGGRIFIYGILKSIQSETKGSNNSLRTKVDVLFFCGGYPDNCSTFQPLAQRFCNNNDIICGVTCLPGYDTHHNNFKSGYTFDEMAVSLQSACKLLLTTVHEHFESNKQSVDVHLTGIFHDWGSYVGAMAVNRCNHDAPNYFRKVVYFDVLPPAHPKLRIKRKPMKLYNGLILLSYTSLFAVCHTIQRFTSYWIAAPIQLLGYSILFILRLLPIRWIDHETFLSKRPEEFTLRKIISMQYTYYEFWRGMLFQGTKQFLKTTISDATLPENVANDNDGGTPVLYMYGTNKNAMFHDENTIAWLQHQNPKSVVQVSNAGHWLYRQQEDICYKEICNFIEK